MVAQASSAGGDRAPKGAPAAFLRPGDMVRVLTAPVAAPCVIVAVIYEHRLHGLFVLYRIAAGTVELLIDPANVVLIGEAATAPAHGPMCECGGERDAAPATDTVADVPEPVGTIEWESSLDKSKFFSPDGRYTISARADGYSVADNWCEEQFAGPVPFASANAWCAAREEGQRLTWKDDRSGWSAGLSDAFFRINRSGQAYFQAVDCRFATTHSRRHSPIMPSLEEAQRWCEVRAACRVEGEGASASLHYTGPIPF